MALNVLAPRRLNFDFTADSERPESDSDASSDSDIPAFELLDLINAFDCSELD